MAKKYANILINTSHYNEQTDSYIYKLPTKLTLQNAYVSCESVSLFNSTYNLTQAFSNNQFTIKWLGVDYNFTIPDGFYSFDDFNNYLKLQCVLNKLYMITTSGDFVYFINVSPNASNYKCQFDFYTIPTSGQATTLGYTIPVGSSWTFPATQETPQLQISTGMLKYFGLKNSLLLPATAQTVNTTISSNTYPQVNPVFAYAFLLNIVSTTVSNEPNLFTQISLDGFGELMKVKNSHDSKIDCQDGQYSEIRLRIVSQDLSPLQRVDKDLVLILKLEY